MAVAPYHVNRAPLAPASISPLTWFLRLLTGVGALIGLWLLQSVCEAYLNAYVVQILTLALINVALAVSLNLINGIAGQFSLGHAGFMAIGAFVSAYFARDIGPLLYPLSPFTNSVTDLIAFTISLFLAALAAGLAGLLVGLPSLRLRGDYLAIVTLGFGQIITSLLRTIKFKGGNTFIDGVPPNTNIFWAGLCALLCILVVRNVCHSGVGRAMRAVREDEVAAEAAGVDTTRAKVIAFVISAMWGGVAGGLFAGVTQVAHPDDYTFVRSVEIVVMVVLGGLGSITGAALSAMLLTGLQEALRAPLAAFIAALVLIGIAALLSLPRYRTRDGARSSAWIVAWLRWPVISLVAVVGMWVLARSTLVARADYLRYILYSLILIVMMLLRPQGLLGRSEFSFAALRRRRAQDEPTLPAQTADQGISGTL